LRPTISTATAAYDTVRPLASVLSATYFLITFPDRSPRRRRRSVPRCGGADLGAAHHGVAVVCLAAGITCLAIALFATLTSIRHPRPELLPAETGK
jgi:hypothetical protein